MLEIRVILPDEPDEVRQWVEVHRPGILAVTTCYYERGRILAQHTVFLRATDDETTEIATVQGGPLARGQADPP